MSGNPANILPSAGKDIIAKVAHRASDVAAQTNFLGMQDLIRAASTWTTRLASRHRTRTRSSSSAGPRSDTSGDEGKFSRTLHDIREISESTWHDLKVSAHEMYDDVTRDVLDMGPLPVNFDYSYALISYVWTVIIMTSKTMGHRAARLDSVNTALELVFTRWIAGVLLYALLPTYTILINQKFSEKQLNLYARRVIIIGLAFVYGLLGEFIWVHWLHFNYTAPYYYYPAIIGITLQLFGHKLGGDRRLLLFACISSTVTVSVAMAIYSGIFSLPYIGTTIISALSSLLNLQLLIGDLRKNGSDERAMVCGHYRTVLVSTYNHAILTLVCARYDHTARNESNAAVE